MATLDDWPYHRFLKQYQILEKQLDFERKEMEKSSSERKASMSKPKTPSMSKPRMPKR
jgi:hypothetical protein